MTTNFFRMQIEKKDMKEFLSYSISYIGVFIVTVYLVTEFIEEGSVQGLIHHLTDDVKLFYHVTVFLTIPVFIVIGYYYRKQINEGIKLENLVSERTEELKRTQAIVVKSEKFAVIGEAATIMAHDLRNPLQGISNATYFLKTKMGSNISAKEEKMIKLIENNINYAENILGDLLEYSKELNLEINEFFLFELIEKALSFIEVPENIYINKFIPPKIRINVDFQKFTRALVNLLDNATDAIPHGGKISITGKEYDKITEIIITDSGEGIPKDILEKVGKPFFTTKAKGIGLGLSISHRIIEAHLGKISIDSNIGTGTTITITLPIKPKSIRNQALSITNM